MLGESKDQHWYTPSTYIDYWCTKQKYNEGVLMDNYKTIEQSEYHKLLQEIRELKEAKKISCQDIVNKTIENNENVGINTVKKVFGTKYLEQTFDYNHTLIPIYNALLDKKDNDDPIIKILNTRLEIKRETIKQLEARLETKDQKHREREHFLMELINDLREELKDYRKEIEFKNEQIRHHNEAMDRKDKALKELYDKLLEKI